MLASLQQQGRSAVPVRSLRQQLNMGGQTNSAGAVLEQLKKTAGASDLRVACEISRSRVGCAGRVSVIDLRTVQRLNRVNYEQESFRSGQDGLIALSQHCVKELVIFKEILMVN